VDSGGEAAQPPADQGEAGDEVQVVVVTDSTSGLPPTLIKQFNIVVVPVPLGLGGRWYRDGVDVSATELYRRLRADRGLFVASSTPSPGEFLAVYDPLLAGGRAVVSVHIAQTLTSIVEVARQAAASRPDGVIEVVDSGTAAMGCGLAVLAAARAASAGLPPRRVAETARRVSSMIQLFGMLDTVRYVRHSGRLTDVGKVADLLGLRPIISVTGGRVHLQGLERSRRRGIERLVRAVGRGSRGAPLRVAVMHADAPEEAAMLSRRLEREQPCAELIVSEFTPLLGGHTGPGFLGVAFCPVRASLF
jgi:DegV family protein with EDD domain